MSLEEKPFENIVEKEENPGFQYFLLFSQCFDRMKKKLHRAHNAFHLDQPKILSSGYGLSGEGVPVGDVGLVWVLFEKAPRIPNFFL